MLINTVNSIHIMLLLACSLVLYLCATICFNVIVFKKWCLLIKKFEPTYEKKKKKGLTYKNYKLYRSPMNFPIKLMLSYY